MADSFQIWVGKYKATVENIYQSEQVSRYKISLKGKYFVLEQLHLKKPSQWKLKMYSDDVDVNKVLGLLESITSQITAYYTPPDTFVHKKKSW